jgi:tRNA (guanosine-2'-O-)-methyltransferase
MKAVLARRLATLTVVLDNVYDPHNLSAVLRSCDAFGIQHVHVIETYEAFELNPKVSQGAERWLTLRHWHTHADCFAHLRAHGFRLHATHMSPAAESVHRVALAQPLAVIFGNEHRGIAPDVIAQCDGCLTIPMDGFVESLNVSVAAAVVMAVLSARLRAAGPETACLSPARQQDVYNAWVERQTAT